MDHRPVGKHFEFVQEIHNFSDRKRQFVIWGNFVMFFVVAGWLLMPAERWITYVQERDFEALVPLVGTIVVMALVVLTSLIRGPRLVIDDNGIAFVSALPGFLQKLQPSWRYSWNEISKIQLPARTLIAASQFTLEIHVRDAVKRVHLLGAWRETGEEKLSSITQQPKLRLLSMRDATRERLESSAVIRALAAHGVDVLPTDQPPVESILRTRKGAAITYGIFGLLAYAVVDSMLQSEVYFQVPVNLMAGVSFVGLVFAFLALIGTGMKLEERIGLPIVLGFALAFATYPGLARINALEGEIQMLEFRQEYDLRFEPVSADAPVLHMKQFGFYWDKFEPGTVHSIAVRRGALGLWVYDAAALREKLHAERE